MTRLRIGTDGFGLKAEVFEDVVAILGRRGRGKTTTATVIVEGLHAAGARFVVTDPVGVWWGLRSSRDGKRPGIPVIVMGGDHGDVPLASESGELIADFVADPSSPSVVLDLKLFTQGEMVRFMTAFLARLYHVNPGRPLHVILDEADQFAPQRPMPGEQAMLGAAQRLTKLGRAKGLHPILITQRPATLSKNVLTQAGILIAHAITGPQDRNAIDDWIKANAEEGEREKFLAELSSLPRGTAYFWSPDIPLFRQVVVRDRETFDSSATPKRGERGPKPKALAEVDLEALRGRIAATIEHHKANDPKELRRKVAELQAALRKAEQARSDAQLRSDGHREKLGTLAASKEKRVEVSVLKPADLKRLEGAAAKLERLFTTHLQEVYDRATAAGKDAAEAAREVSRLVRQALAVPSGPAQASPRAGERPAFTRAAKPATTPPPRGADGDAAIGKGERVIMAAIAQRRGPASPEYLTVATGYKRSSRNTYLQRLQSAGMVVRGGNGWLLTEAGVAEARDAIEVRTGHELRNHYLRTLPQGESKMLDALLQAYPEAVDRGDAGQALGYERSSRNTYLQRLTSRGLVVAERGGLVRAHEDLFS